MSERAAHPGQPGSVFTPERIQEIWDIWDGVIERGKGEVPSTRSIAEAVGMDEGTLRGWLKVRASGRDAAAPEYIAFRERYLRYMGKAKLLYAQRAFNEGSIKDLNDYLGRTNPNEYSERAAILQIEQNVSGTVTHVMTPIAQAAKLVGDLFSRAQEIDVTPQPDQLPAPNVDLAGKIQTRRTEEVEFDPLQ